MSVYNFGITVTQALADTVIDDSRDGRGTPRPAGGVDTSTLPDVGDTVGNLYRLVRLLGKGMFGKVYAAERVDVPEHRVAIKLMPREVYTGRNVERELVMLAAASHPNVVQLKDHGATDQYVWLTMPVYEGETLSARLERGTLGLREAYEIFVPIARGIEALHGAGLRHQDLKPENIFLARFAGRIHPIILDLGVAAECTADFVAGTILFASPEQIRALSSNKQQVSLDEKMDTYSLAATLLLALVGPVHFQGMVAQTRDDIEKAQKERAMRPLRPSALLELQDTPRETLTDAFRHWLALSPGDRSSMGEMAEQLDVLLEHERELSNAEVRRQHRQKNMLRRLWVVVGILILVGLGVLGYGYSKRETLRMASELARARAEGAASFDKLETCVASHDIEKRERVRCQDQRTRDQADFGKMVTNLTQTGTSGQGECGRQLISYVDRLRTCEDTATTQEKAYIADRTKMSDDCTAKEKSLTVERDDQRKLAAEVQDRLQQCRTELASRHDSPYGEPSAAAGGAAPLPAPPAAPSAAAAATPASAVSPVSPPATTSRAPALSSPPPAPPAPAPTSSAPAGLAATAR